MPLNAFETSTGTQIQIVRQGCNDCHKTNLKSKIKNKNQANYRSKLDKQYTKNGNEASGTNTLDYLQHECEAGLLKYCVR